MHHEERSMNSMKKKAMYGKTATRITLLLATVAALGAPKKW